MLLASGRCSPGKQSTGLTLERTALEDHCDNSICESVICSTFVSSESTLEPPLGAFSWSKVLLLPLQSNNSDSTVDWGGRASALGAATVEGDEGTENANLFRTDSPLVIIAFYLDPNDRPRAVCVRTHSVLSGAAAADRHLLSAPSQAGKRAHAQVQR